MIEIAIVVHFKMITDDGKMSSVVFNDYESYHSWMDITEWQRQANQMGKRMILKSIETYTYNKSLDVALENAASVARVEKKERQEKKEKLLAQRAELDKQIAEL
jgi:hypothetical protein